MCLTCILCSLQVAGVSSGVGGGVVVLDENGSVVMGGEVHDPSPLQGITGGASSEDLDSLQALTSISQVSLAALHVLIQPQTECSGKQRRKAWYVN